MPVVYVDSEAAELVEAAVQMLEAALSARVKRRDPDKFISNSLTLQAHKLATFRAMLNAPPPPPFGGMVEQLQAKAYRAAHALRPDAPAAEREAAWATLRGLVNAAEIAPPAPAR